MIAELSPLVDAIDKNVQVGTVKELCASAAKAALDTLTEIYLWKEIRLHF